MWHVVAHAFQAVLCSPYMCFKPCCAVLLTGAVSPPPQVNELLHERNRPDDMRLAERVEAALVRLVECRDILANSYIFCFYAFGTDALNGGLSQSAVWVWFLKQISSSVIHAFCLKNHKS